MDSLYLHRPHALLAGALLLAACGPETGDSTASSTSDSSTAGPTSSTSSTAEPTSAATTTETGDPATTSPPTTGEPATSSSSTTGDTSDTSGTSTTDAATDLVLDPASLTFFELPIGSIRHAVGGFDPAQQTCVSVIFFGDIETEVCDAFEVGSNFGFPYLVITPNAAPPCMDWDYAGNVTLDAATGCVQLTSHDPLAIAIDMQMTVTGAPFTGTISVASP